LWALLIEQADAKAEAAARRRAEQQRAWSAGRGA